jgi:Peptidase_C39 like family
MTLIFRTTNATILKRKPIQALELPETEKQTLDADKELEVQSYLPERDHLRVAFTKDSFKGYNTWYAYLPHIQILQDGAVVLPKPKPETLKLNVPYKSQLDNEENPTGSCNVTSMAMCLEYLGAKRRQNFDQFEDELYRYAIERGLNGMIPMILLRL